MNKITLPTAACKRGQALDVFYHNLVDFKYNNNVEIVVSVTNDSVILEGSFDLTIAEIELILASGGEITQMLSAIHVTDWTTFKATSTLTTLPWYLNLISGTVRTFANWLNQGEVWYNASNEALFYTNPRSTNAEDYLTGSQIKMITDMATAEHITLAAANALIAAGGWTKYV
jgi:hypothetical protein